jgi:hypothetical protein
VSQKSGDRPTFIRPSCRVMGEPSRTGVLRSAGYADRG